MCFPLFKMNVLIGHRRQKLTILHLFTDLFHKEIFPRSLEYLQGYYSKYFDE